ncbi:unnamed protein product [Cochlearia groenlandica]
MEICEENQSMTPRKRKPDDSQPLDSSNYGDMIASGGDGDDDDDDDVSSRDSGQEWGVDSFDEGEEYIPKRKLDPNDEENQKIHRYRTLIYQTNGFNVNAEDYPGHMAFRDLLPVDLDQPYSTALTGRVYMQELVDLAVARYNQINKSTLMCTDIVRAIVDTAPKLKAYITFMAKETPDGDYVEYQAKIHQRPWQASAHALFCRPTPQPKVIRERADDEDSSSSSGYDSNASSRESDQEWGVDSMDDESDFKPPCQMCPSEEEIQKMNAYRPQMYKSKGFYVDGEKYPGRVVYFSQVNLDEPYYGSGVTGRGYMEKKVDEALKKYNAIKGSSVTFDSIVRANLTFVTGHKLYITFMAKESEGGDTVEYQAKSEWKIDDVATKAL